MMNRAHPWFFIAFLAIGTNVLPCKAADTWPGRRVILRPGVVFTKGDRSYNTEHTFLVFCTVQRQEGATLLVNTVHSSNMLSFTVSATDVIDAKDAIARFSDDAQNQATGAWPYIYCGMVYLEDKRYDDALNNFDKAVRRDAGNAFAYYCHGLACELKGAIDGALADYDEVIRLDPDFAVVYCDRGRVWQAKSHHDRAIADFTKAIRLDPVFTSAYVNRGESWRLTSDLDRAITDYTRAICLDSNHTLAYYNRGLAWQAKSEHKRAIDDFTEAIRLDPQCKRAYYNRGDIWITKGEYDKALSDFASVVRIDPKNHWAYAQQAWIWAVCPTARFRDGEKAVGAATKACELTNWENAYRMSLLAASHAEAGDFGAAIASQKKAQMLCKTEAERANGHELLELYENGQKCPGIPTERP